MEHVQNPRPSPSGREKRKRDCTQQGGSRGTVLTASGAGAFHKASHVEIINSHVSITNNTAPVVQQANQSESTNTSSPVTSGENLNRCTDSVPVTQAPDRPRARGAAGRGQRRPRNRPQQGCLSRNALYEKHLMHKRPGHPLYIPHLSMRLPDPYRKRGISIGDVGLITEFGAFDFLFNMCLSATDEINALQLPDGFEPLHPPLDPLDIWTFRQFNDGSHLASSSVSRTQTGTPSSWITFQSSASEGAILTMPKGAFQEELGNTRRFRDYVAIHGENMYKFVNGPRGREARNGDLRVVIGCDKATCWGMATFSNVSNASQLQFRALETQGQALERTSSPLYAWDYSGMEAEARVGPDAENDGLRSPDSDPLLNQTLFLRTLSVTLSDESWAKLNPTTSVNSDERQPPPTVLPPTSSSPASSSSSTPSNGTSADSTSPGGRSSSNFMTMCLKDEDTRAGDDKYATLVGSPTGHLSKAINEFLLKSVPSAKMAITSDRDWQWLLSSVYQPSPETVSDIITKICAQRTVGERNGVAFFERNDRTAETHSQEIEDIRDLLLRISSGQTTGETFLFGSTLNRRSFLAALIKFLRSGDRDTLSNDQHQSLPGHPIRLLSVDELDQLHQRYVTSGNLEGLETLSTTKLEEDLSLLPHGHEDRPRALRNLARCHLKRYRRFHQEHDLSGALWYGQAALALTPADHHSHLETLLDLCSSLYQRFRLRGQDEDLKNLISRLENQIGLDFRSLITPVDALFSKCTALRLHLRSHASARSAQQSTTRAMSKGKISSPKSSYLPVTGPLHLPSPLPDTFQTTANQFPHPEKSPIGYPKPRSSLARDVELMHDSTEALETTSKEVTDVQANSPLHQTHASARDKVLGSVHEPFKALRLEGEKKEKDDGDEAVKDDEDTIRKRRRLDGPGQSRYGYPLSDPFIPFLDDPEPSLFPPEGGLQGTPASAMLYNFPTSPFLSFPPSPASGSHPSDYFSMPAIFSTDDNLMSQPRGQSAHTAHDNLYWAQEKLLTRAHVEHSSLIFESQQATSSLLKLGDGQGSLSLGASRSAIPSDPFTIVSIPPSLSAGPTGEQQPGTLDPTYMPALAEDDSVEEMKERIVDLLVDALNIDEARNRIRMLCAEKGSTLPGMLFNQAATRTVGTTEVQTAASKRKTKVAHFACVFCAYRLTAKANLKNHYRNHLDYKPSRCQVSGCGMRFGNPSGLKRHMEKKHHVAQLSKRARPEGVQQPES